ncbi:MAG: rod-determining factor RdfA [Halolamina sp.]
MTEHGCKVCRVLAERDLEHLNEVLVARWHGETGERMGYRRLADWLNTTLLRTEMEIVGMATAGGEARSRYERLVDADGTGAELRDVLRRGGVAVDDLLDDFVSYSVVRTHLTDCLGERRDPSPPTDWEEDRLTQLESYAAEEAGDAVRSLVNKGKLAAGGEIEPVVTVEVRCSDCGVSVPVGDAIGDDPFCDCPR